eukprot:849751-Prymnesium_polylepis.3
MGERYVGCKGAFWQLVLALGVRHNAHLYSSLHTSIYTIIYFRITSNIESIGEVVAVMGMTRPKARTSEGSWSARTPPRHETTPWHVQILEQYF